MLFIPSSSIILERLQREITIQCASRLLGVVRHMWTADQQLHLTSIRLGTITRTLGTHTVSKEDIKLINV